MEQKATAGAVPDLPRQAASSRTAGRQGHLVRTAQQLDNSSCVLKRHNNHGLTNTFPCPGKNAKYCSWPCRVLTASWLLHLVSTMVA